jgi:hypothetical protein
MRLHGQLQHTRTLTCAEIRDQHDLAIRELKSIMVRIRIVQVHLPKPSYLVTEVLRFPPEKAQLKSSNLTLDFAFERDLSARKKAHGYLGLSSGGESAGRGIPKFRGDQLVSDRRRSGHNIVQTVVAHGGEAPIFGARQPVALLAKSYGQVIANSRRADDRQRFGPFLTRALRAALLVLDPRLKP